MTWREDITERLQSRLAELKEEIGEVEALLSLLEDEAPKPEETKHKNGKTQSPIEERRREILSRMTDRESEAVPIAYLEQRTGLSRQHINSILRDLMKSGRVARKAGPQKVRGVGRGPNLYWRIPVTPHITHVTVDKEYVVQGTD